MAASMCSPRPWCSPTSAPRCRTARGVPFVLTGEEVDATSLTKLSNRFLLKSRVFRKGAQPCGPRKAMAATSALGVRSTFTLEVVAQILKSRESRVR